MPYNSNIYFNKSKYLSMFSNYVRPLKVHIYKYIEKFIKTLHVYP